MTERLVAHRHRDRGARIDDFDPSHESFCRAKRQTSDPVVSGVLLYLENQLVVGDLCLKRVVHRRHLVRRKLHIDHGADYLRYFSVCHCFSPEESILMKLA